MDYQQHKEALEEWVLASRRAMRSRLNGELDPPEAPPHHTLRQLHRHALEQAEEDSPHACAWRVVAQRISSSIGPAYLVDLRPAQLSLDSFLPSLMASRATEVHQTGRYAGFIKSIMAYKRKGSQEAPEPPRKRLEPPPWVQMPTPEQTKEGMRVTGLLDTCPECSYPWSGGDTTCPLCGVDL